MKSSVIVLSDIDGTLIPHPFLSGVSTEAKGEDVMRMFALFEHKNFGLVTGRRKVGFERFFREYPLSERLPAFLAVEFATHVAVLGKWVVQRIQNESVAKLMRELNERVSAQSEFCVGHDLGAALNRGWFDTYFLEEKTLCAQIEGHFPDPALLRRYFSFVEGILNPYTVGANGLAVQSFPSMGRIDVLEPGFVPKSGFWPVIEAHREALNLAPDAELTVVALGDEHYDSYMFRYLKEELGERFRGVITVSVGHVLNYATHKCPNTRSALSFVEKVLSEGLVRDSFLEDLEAVG
jgi:hypothetical protein